MSKISEELVKLSNNAARKTSKRTIKIPAAIVEKETKAKQKETINNIISIDSLKDKKNNQKKSKRTLSLNLGNNKTSNEKEELPISEEIDTTETPSPVEETPVTPIIITKPFVPKATTVQVPKDRKTVINLASPFFYTPSVFEQYNIEISNADIVGEETGIENKEQETSVEEVIENDEQETNTDEIIKNAEQETNIEEIIEDDEHETNIEEIIEDDRHETNIEDENNSVEEIIIEDNDFIEEAIIENLSDVIDDEIISENAGDSVEEINENNIEKIIEEPTVDFEDNTNEIFEEYSDIADIEESIALANELSSTPVEQPVIQPAVDTVDLDALISQDTVNESYFKSITPVEETPVKEVASSVGFLVEEPTSKPKVVTPKTSSFKSIFKKFSYDEAELMNSVNELENDSPIISNINTISDVQKTLENAKIGQEKDVTELNVQANPIATIPVLENDVDVITAIDSSSNYSQDNDINILNILSPESNSFNFIDDEDTNEVIDNKVNDNNFTIESYFNLGNTSDDIEENTSNYEDINDIGENLLDDNADIEFDKIQENHIEEKQSPVLDEQPQHIAELITSLTDTINSLTNRITELEKTKLQPVEDTSIQEISEESEPDEDEQAIIADIIKELDEEFVFEDDLKLLEGNSDTTYDLENKIDELDDIIIEDNDPVEIEDSIFDDMLNDISLDDIDLEDLSSSITMADVISDNKELPEETNIDTISDEEKIDDINIEDISPIDFSDLFEIEDIIDAVPAEEVIEDIIEETPSEEIIDEEQDILEENTTETLEDNNIESIIDNILVDKPQIPDEDSLLGQVEVQTNNSLTENEIESILEDALSSDENIKEKLLTGLFGENVNTNNDEINIDGVDKEITSDFLKVIDTLTQTISKLEQNSSITSEKNEVIGSTGKAINIEIDKDDIFSISILNETYEIVADFDGISVLSENIHISTPKNNFFVKIGKKYIEIHNHKTHYEVYTNFEDIEFANALNNVGFTKKNNRIELTIKEAFKLSSIDNKVSLSMLNTSIADIEGANSQNNAYDDESSVCDNKTLVISEETQKVYLPYTIKDIMEKLNDVSTGYQTVQDVIDEEYTVPLSEFKMPVISRFKEAYKFMRIKEKSSVYAAIDLALELMFNSNLNPAIIRASKNLRELNIYLDCLYENELEKFDCFKVIYKVLPKIK